MAAVRGGSGFSSSSVTGEGETDVGEGTRSMQRCLDRSLYQYIYIFEYQDDVDS